MEPHDTPEETAEFPKERAEQWADGDAAGGDGTTPCAAATDDETTDAGDPVAYADDGGADVGTAISEDGRDVEAAQFVAKRHVDVGDAQQVSAATADRESDDYFTDRRACGTVNTLDLPRRDVLGAVALSVAGTGCLADDEQDDPNRSDDEPASPNQTSEDEDDPTDATETAQSGDDQQSPDDQQPSDDSAASDGRHQVTVGPGDSFAFEPERLLVEQGATVSWTWDSDHHNVEPTSAPDGADWDGHPEIESAGTEYEHAFAVPGRYEYQCAPHAAAGMTGEIAVAGPDGEVPFGGTIDVGPDGDLLFEPERVEIEPGTTVRWVWNSDGHNVEPVSVPDDADWNGHPEIGDRGNEYEYTFDVPGTYEYECEPHAVAGMTGTIVVSGE